MPFKSIFSIGLLFSFLSSVPALADELHVYAGAGLRTPTEVIVKRFEEKTGHKVTVEYAGMGQLLARFNANESGDVFLSGSEFYVDEIAKKHKHLAQYKLVYHTPVLVLLKDRANGIETYEQLAKSKLRLAMGDPKAIALGKSGEELLEATGFGEKLKEKVVVRGTTIKQVLLYLLNGDVDGAIIGRSDAKIHGEKFIALPIPETISKEVSIIAALSTSKYPETTRAFVAFFAEPENIKEFTDRGYIAFAGNE